MWKIMLVEDESLLRKALKKIISVNPEYEVCCEAANGSIALEYLNTHKVDIIISDIRMPSMDGLELIQKIKELNISAKTIILTGYSDFEYARHMLVYDAFSYLLKPVVPEELLKTIEDACEKIKQEGSNKSILKSHTFQDFQKQGYAHFTNEMPGIMLNSTKLTACCIDFEQAPQKEELVLWQLDFERDLYPCCCFWLDSYLYLVLDLALPDKDLTETITEIQLYFENRDISTRIGIGLNADSMMGISNSMKQARKALHHYHHLSYHEIVYYERISLLEDRTIPYPLTEEKNLLDAVTSLDKADIHKYISQIHDQLVTQSTELIYQNLTELIFSCRRELSQYRFVMEWEDLYYAVRNRIPWEQTLQQLENLLDSCHLNLLEARANSNTPTILRARQYIREHSSQALTLDEVANYCYLSKSHFCKIFKTETGMTFKAYLNQQRIESAKNLLKTSSLKNYEIAEIIGFDDPSYFHELFKKSVGMTPTEYRNSAS